ncbi:MAG TPA: sigma-70 family RNA polymerase sigma factor [Candidatus Fimimorpha excrementavium]|nr:sigma-70 family RNA polymerase sigma factor [Candidatus Fimimorpha excrementavium]
MLTLQDLKWIAKEPKTGKKVPSARYLLEQGEQIVSMENGGGVQLLVFREGYALYRVGKYTTVFPIHSCGNYCYENDGQKICVDADFFEGKEWYVRLLLEGEDRLAKNREAYHKERVVSYHAVSEEWFFLTSPVLPPLEQLIEKEKILELMSLLTERQRDIVILYFYYGETQWEIANALGVSQPTVSQTLMTALRRMRDGQKDISSEKKAGSGKGGALYAG